MAGVIAVTTSHLHEVNTRTSASQPCRTPYKRGGFGRLWPSKVRSKHLIVNDKDLEYFTSAERIPDFLTALRSPLHLDCIPQSALSIHPIRSTRKTTSIQHPHTSKDRGAKQRNGESITVSLHEESPENASRRSAELEVPKNTPHPCKVIRIH